jgi:hypothetical protein
VVLRANESDPLLATWQYGLGRAVAFTSDANGRWAKSWVQWPDFPRFWAQAVRWTILERSQSAIQASVQQRGDQTVITADMPDARVNEDLRLNATVIDSEGESRDVTLQQVAPGRFEAETYLDQAGAYFVRVRPAISVTGEVSSPLHAAETTVAYVRPYSPEYAPSEGGEEALRDWAALGGGGLLAAPADAFALNAPVAASRTDLFPFLLALAAVLLPFDVGVRRITVSLRKLFGGAGAKLAPAESLEGSGRMTQLMQAKTRVTRSPLSSSPQHGPAAPATTQTRQPATQPEPAPSPQAAATASELLKRRKQREAGDALETDDAGKNDEAK